MAAVLRILLLLVFVLGCRARWPEAADFILSLECGASPEEVAALAEEYGAYFYAPTESDPSFHVRKDEIYIMFHMADHESGINGLIVSKPEGWPIREQETVGVMCLCREQ